VGDGVVATPDVRRSDSADEPRRSVGDSLGGSVKGPLHAAIDTTWLAGTAGAGGTRSPDGVVES
jgi:hypothetical protein